MADKRITDLSLAGALTGEELVAISQLSTTARISAATISAAAADNSYNDSAAGFIAAGFVVGDRVNVSGFTGNVLNNILVGEVTALTAGKMTIGGADGDVIVDDAAGETVVIAKWVSRRAPYGGGGSGLAFDFYGDGFAIIPRFNNTTPYIVGENITVTNTVARTIASTNQFTKRKRTGITIASGSGFGQIRPSDGGHTVGVGCGWQFRCLFGVVTTATNGRILCGCSGGWDGATDPSATTNMAGFMIGCDSLDTNLQLMHGDGVGAAVKVDLGASFPARTSSADRYEVILSSDEGSTSMDYYVKNLTTGAEASGSITTDIPPAGTIGSWGLWTGANGTAGLSVDFFGMTYQQLALADF